MIGQPLDRRDERAECQSIARCQPRRQRSIFGPRPEVAGAEHDGQKRVHIVVRERRPSCEPHLDRGARRLMRAVKTGRQRRRVVGDHEIAGTQQVGETRSGPRARLVHARRRRGAVRGAAAAPAAPQQSSGSLHHRVALRHHRRDRIRELARREFRSL